MNKHWWLISLLTIPLIGLILLAGYRLQQGIPEAHLKMLTEATE